MLEEPHDAILNRTESADVAKKHFAKQTELLRDLANYGSNLIIRSFNTSPKKMAEIVVCGVLLKQIVAMTDAAEVLISAGCGHAAFLPARTAFEASIYLDWIVAKDSELRATRYIVANFREERVWANRAIPGTVEESTLSKNVEQRGFDLYAKHPNLASDSKAHLVEVNRILAQADLKLVDEEFAAAKGKRKRDPEWFELDGLSSIRQIAEKVGRVLEYDFFYAKGSQVTHTGTYKDHIRFTDGQIRFKPIRHLADVTMLLNFIVSICIRVYQVILEKYRPGEMPAFWNKYLSDWRDPFLNIPTVKYNFG